MLKWLSLKHYNRVDGVAFIMVGALFATGHYLYGFVVLISSAVISGVLEGIYNRSNRDG